MTAEVRRTGADSAEASISQRLTVEALPEEVITASGATLRTATLPTTTRAGTPGFVPSISFYDVEARSFKVRWGTPSDGGRPLTGFGLLLWTGSNQPAYSSAHVVGGSVRSHHYGGKDPSTTYKFRIHACNGTDSCGYWTNPPKEVTTDSTATPTPTATPTSPPDPVRPPGPVKNLSFTKDRHSFTVNWTAPDDDGGTTIKGYGILQWRDGSSRPAYSKATTVSGTSKTYSGLNEDTTYWVKVHACNGPDSCGPWTADTSVRTTKNSTPPVTGLGVTAGKNSLTIAWTAPSPPAGTTLGGYTVQHRRQGTAWPSGSEAPPATATSWTITGLINGTPTDVQIQACYGSAGCSDWKAISGIPGNKVGNARIEVAKTTIDIGERLQVTVYDIPVGEVAYMNMNGSIQPEGRCPARAAGAAVPRRFGEPSTGGWYDSFRIDGCADGGLGHIRVTNADESELYASVTITVRGADPPPDPPEPEPIDPAVDPPPPLPPPTCDEISDSLPPAPTALDPLTNLAIEPRLQRQAVLKWKQIPAAEEYRIVVRRLKDDPVDGLTWDAWTGPIKATAEAVKENCYTIDLDNIIARSAAVHNLFNTPAFGFRVTAIRVGSTPSSAEIILIDNPITVANGHSPTTPAGPGGQLPPGRVELAWKSVPGILSEPSDITYAGGIYHFRFRRVSGNHDRVGWRPDIYAEVKTIDEFDLDSDRRYQGLVRESIYAIQAIYSKANEPLVFSAADAYVWPSGAPADSGQRVASFPLSQRLPANKTYYYRVCDSTFDLEGWDRKNEWLELIRDVFDKWNAATGNLVRGTRVLLPCADYSQIIRMIVGEIDAIKMMFPGIDKAGITINVTAYLDNIIHGLVTGRNQDDLEASEIILFDDVPGTTAAHLAAELNFKEISWRIGYSTCWDPAAPRGPGEEIGLGEANIGVMCAVSEDVMFRRGGQGVTTDIFIWRYYYSELEVRPLHVVEDLLMHPCFANQSSAYGAFMHEVGHAFGVGGGNEYDSGGVGNMWNDTFHPQPSLKDSSIMAGSHPDCSPYPFDVLAIYALYQSS